MLKGQVLRQCETEIALMKQETQLRLKMVLFGGQDHIANANPAPQSVALRQKTPQPEAGPQVLPASVQELQRDTRSMLEKHEVPREPTSSSEQPDQWKIIEELQQ